VCGSDDDDEDASQCVVETMMRMVVCGSEDGSRCVVVTMMSMVVSVW